MNQLMKSGWSTLRPNSSIAQNIPMRPNLGPNALIIAFVRLGLYSVFPAFIASVLYCNSLFHSLKLTNYKISKVKQYLSFSKSHLSNSSPRNLDSSSGITWYKSSFSSSVLNPFHRKDVIHLDSTINN